MGGKGPGINRDRVAARCNRGPVNPINLASAINEVPPAAHTPLGLRWQRLTVRVLTTPP